MSSQGLLEQIKASCERIAACIEERQPEAQITQTLERTVAVCEQASANEQPSNKIAQGSPDVKGGEECARF